MCRWGLGFRLLLVRGFLCSGAELGQLRHVWTRGARIRVFTGHLFRELVSAIEVSCFSDPRADDIEFFQLSSVLLSWLAGAID
jgi:hypothetical protein